jgi:23S rRNA (guanosine2251-2'-O)-methyltransferase
LLRFPRNLNEKHFLFIQGVVLFGEIVMGINSVLELLESKQRKVLELYLYYGLSGEKIRYIKQLATENNVSINMMNKHDISQIVGSEFHQGVAAKTWPLKNWNIDELIEDSLKQSENPLLLVLDGIKDPHNLGAIIRSAEFFGADGLIIRKRRQVSLTPVVMKTASGAAEHLPVCVVSNINQVIPKLKEYGYWVVGLETEMGDPIEIFLTPHPIALIVGGEGKGISRLTGENCDAFIHISGYGEITSLNVSVATAVAIYGLKKTKD